MAYPFIPAKNYTKGRIAKVRVIVIHDMEAGEVKGTARSVANRFGSEHAPQASAHYCVDRDEIIQCVRDEDTAWHAPGCNADGIGIEHAGMAKQSRRDWTDAYSARMLVRSAKLTAALCRKHGIPPVHLTAEDLRAGKKGIVGHVQVSAVYKRSDHWDPGPDFPWDVFLTSVKAEYDALAGRTWTKKRLASAAAAAGVAVSVFAGVKVTSDPAPKPAPKPTPRPSVTVTKVPAPRPTPTAIPRPPRRATPAPRIRGPLRYGSTGDSVKALQRHLHVTPTGYFGRITLRKVKAVQAAADLTQDGVVGPRTAAAMGFTYAAK